MALPKRRQSKSSGTKEKNSLQVFAYKYSKCKETGEVHLRHRAYYHNGVFIIKESP